MGGCGGTNVHFCCEMITTTPRPTTTPTHCGSFTCASPFVPKPGSRQIMCGSKGCNDDTCCLKSCSKFACPQGLAKKKEPEKAICDKGICSPAICCNSPTTTPCPTTTVLTCHGYKCPHPLTIRYQPDRINCPGKGGCSPALCCLVPTTTPMSTTTRKNCGGFLCPVPLMPRFQMSQILCDASGCSAHQCCLKPTTTLGTCAGFPCQVERPGSTLRFQPDRIMCHASGCTEQQCCLLPTSTLGTCAGYMCPAPMALRIQPSRITCSGACSEQLCCLMPTSTPAGSPCTTLAPARLFADQKVVMAPSNEAHDAEASTSAASRLPFFGMLTLAVFAAGIGASAFKLRARRSTRQLRNFNVEDGNLIDGVDDMTPREFQPME